MKVYWAQWKFGEPALLEVEVAKETALTYVPLYKDGKVLLGKGWNTYVGKRIFKNDNVFQTQAEAAAWLRGQIAEHVGVLQGEIELLKGLSMELADMEKDANAPYTDCTAL